MKPFRRQGQLPFKMPFAKAVESLRKHALSRDDFDPATLFVWGQINAVAVIEMLKEVESRCGDEGQRACIDALQRVGQRVARESVEGVEVPPDLSAVEVGSPGAPGSTRSATPPSRSLTLRGPTPSPSTSSIARTRTSTAPTTAVCSDTWCRA